MSDKVSLGCLLQDSHSGTVIFLSLFVVFNPCKNPSSMIESNLVEEPNLIEIKAAVCTGVEKNKI